MTIKVTAPNGSVIEFPAGTDEATMNRAMSQFMGSKPPAPEAPKVGILESMRRGATTGVFMGFEDELGIADKKRQAEAKAANPISSFAGELVGGVGSSIAATFLPGAQVAAPAKYAGVGKTLWNGGKATYNAARGLLVAKPAATTGAAMKEGAKLGAVYGGISGAGQAEEGGRMEGAAGGAAAGGIVGGALGPVAHKIGERYQIAQAAKKEMQNSDTASLAALDRSLARDSIDPKTLIDQIQVPQYGKLTADQISEIAERVGRGETVDAAGQALGVGPAAARMALQRFEAQNASPLSMVDRARLTGVAGGENTAWTMRAAMASPGQGRAKAAEALTQRQLDQAPRLANVADDLVAAGDPAKRMQAMKTAEDAAYSNARNVAQPFDLSNIAATALQKNTGFGDDISSSMVEAAKLFLPSAQGAYKPHQNLEHFQRAKMALDYMLEKSKNNGAPTTLTRELKIFKDQIMGEVSKTNPAWREANDLFASDSVARRMFRDVESTGFRLTPESKGQMTRLAKLHEVVAPRSKATPQQRQIAQAEIDMARDAFANAVKAVTLNARETGDHTARLLTPAAQQFARAVMGRKDGDRFIKALREEQAITQSYRALGGSQTTPLREAIDELNGPPLIASALKNWSPTELASAVVAKGSAKLSEARNNRMLPMMVDADPKKQLALFRDIQKMRNARTTGGRRAVSAVPAFANAVSSAGRLPNEDPAPAMARKR